MKRPRPNHCRLSTSAICITAVLVCTSAAANANADEPWTGFGQAATWRSELATHSDTTPSLLWKVAVGEGRSQIVGDSTQIYVASGSATKRKGEPDLLTTRIRALNPKDGSQTWENKVQSDMYETQETFGGAKQCPRATPLLIGDRLLAISFTGQLVCLHQRDGTVAWEKDLVKDFGAVPVQFGFTSSPVLDPTSPDRVCVLAAGKTGGLFCLNLSDGSVHWKASCATFSYATPVLAEFGNIQQWVVVSQNEVLGISTAEGKQLWRYALTEPGLTNVPTPLVVDSTRLIVSGQGVKGTRGLEITHSGNTWSVTQLWFNRELQFFYTNWATASDRIVIGCTDKFLAAIDTTDGNTVGRWRGFSDGNVLLTKQNRMMILGGRGRLSMLNFLVTGDTKSLELQQQFRVGDGRFWTPISNIGTRMYVRTDKDLLCLDTKAASTTEPLKTLLKTPRRLAFKKSNRVPKQDPVAMIFQTFEQKGQQQALALYSKLRADKQLDEDARIAIAEAAREAKQLRLVKLIMTHAEQDFPQSQRIRDAAKSLIPK